MEQYDTELIQAIRTLQDYLRRAATPEVGQGQASLQATASPRTSRYSTQQLVDVLHTEQNKTRSVSGSVENAPAGKVALPEMQTLGQSIVGQLQDHSTDGQLSPFELHTIDLVGMLFTYMLSEEQLPDSVKALLSYLHTPFLKVAFLDASFFEQKEHPARLLLNALVEAGSKWVGNDGTEQYEMFAKIKDVVSRVLEKFENDLRLFAELLFEFGAHVKKITRRQDLMEKREMERFQGEEKLREVKVRANQEVRSRTDGKALPSAVLLLLLQPWADYLAFLLLRYGENSASWTRALEAIDELLRSVQVPPETVNRKQHQAWLNRVLDILRDGLTTIGYDPRRAEKMLEALGSLQQMAMQHKKTAPAPVPVRKKLESEAADKAGDQSKLAKKVSTEERRLVEHLKMIEFGTWFELEGGKRVKVAWYNAKTMHYMLVNQMGRQVAMKSGVDLAREMLAGKARVIAGSTKPFFDRALENILQSLNNKAIQAESDNE